MAIERTLSLIKPDATGRNLTGAINKMIEESGLNIIAQKRLKLNKAQAEAFYHVHRGKDFFDPLVESMTAGDIVAQVLEGEDAIARYRQLMGPTNPEKQPKDCIRAIYGLGFRRNSVHGSDSLENAAEEIHFFFAQIELIK
ncbi:MAG: nucleoside-diphosphate kinase [Alphaproteobacteria bacterium]